MKTMLGPRIVTVDAFADRPFSGNPAAVCILPEAPPDSWMRLVAREMNLSETAFIVPRADGDGFDLRWLTPAVEVDLCGHATLASAHVLWEEGHLPPDAIAAFHTRSGRLTAEKRGESIILDFPAKPLRGDRDDAPLAELAAALGTPIVQAGFNAFDILVEVGSEAEVRSMKPDFSALAKLPVRGVIVTSRAETSGIDFVSRFFAPAAGVAEDPVTGSAHCCLGPHWAPKLGKTRFRAYQASARGGFVDVELIGDRVRLGGSAITVMQGRLAEPPREV